MASTTAENATEFLVRVHAGSVIVEGNLDIPPAAGGIVLFAHGSGSSRHSPRNRFVAQSLREHGLATAGQRRHGGDGEHGPGRDGHPECRHDREEQPQPADPGQDTAEQRAEGVADGLVEAVTASAPAPGRPRHWSRPQNGRRRSKPSSRAAAAPIWRAMH